MNIEHVVVVVDSAVGPGGIYIWNYCVNSSKREGPCCGGEPPDRSRCRCECEERGEHWDVMCSFFRAQGSPRIG